MKQFLSVILVLVLMVAVSGSVVNGTMAGFFDSEVSTENLMCAGNRMIELSGGPIQVDAVSPSTWYEHEMVVTNAGTLGGTAWLHVFNVRSIEDKPGWGEATAEPELVAEEGGQHGQVWLPGLGIDCGDDTLGPAGLEMANFVDIEIWYDEDGDEANGFEKEVVSGKLADIECNWYELGFLPSSAGLAIKKGSWGTYFTYVIGPSPMETTLVAGKHFIVGKVTIETKEVKGTDCLIVTYDTTAYQWPMEESHLYVDTVPPPKSAPGQFPYTSNPDNRPPDDTQYNKTISDYLHEYIIPLSTVGVVSGDPVFIAAHAAEQPPGDDTAWAMGEYRKLLIRLHFPDIDEDDLIRAGLLAPPLEPALGDGGYFDGTDPDIILKCWDHWPTNAFMGDKSIFDIEFLLTWEGQEPPL